MSLLTPNPALENGFGRPTRAAARRTTPGLLVTNDAMTLRGTVAKTALCLAVVAATGAWAWTLTLSGWAVLALIAVTFAMSIAITIRPTRARALAVPYAALEGLAVGTISRWYADGAVIAGAEGTALVWSALGLTVAVAAGLLAVYATGIIKPSANFRLAVTAATGGVALFYLATIGLRLFGVTMPLVHSTGIWGIAFSVAVVALAAACLVIDFDFVERGVEAGMPKHMEWYAAFGLMVTLVWLYLELLRLLAKTQSRR